MTDDAWPVRTARLEIRRARPDDLDGIWAYRSLPEVNQWLGRIPGSLETFRERMQDPERLSTLFVISPASHGDAEPVIIGDVMVRISDGWAQQEVADQAVGVEAELGWVLAPAFTGRGYATEAIRAVIDVCFGSLGLRRIHAGCFAANESSWRLMERLGMRREEFSRRTALHRSGEWMDGMNYGLLAEEWTA
ncbi:GNAT family N-acetyltransferase [Microbacterium sp. M28]|uniref:GNAT family N-acetyltransferase n=1 Tax=Microbacterium sp. M28 TaxID=2962064 RepID=UPI0021F48B62|nr:GNAT family protein [Microbacterium sp. M28]UYO96822.1 GNAT family N-acetyltransferase [Microbacterium sp. M28]